VTQNVLYQTAVQTIKGLKWLSRRFLFRALWRHLWRKSAIASKRCRIGDTHTHTHTHSHNVEPWYLFPPPGCRLPTYTAAGCWTCCSWTWECRRRWRCSSSVRSHPSSSETSPPSPHRWVRVFRVCVCVSQPPNYICSYVYTLSTVPRPHTHTQIQKNMNLSVCVFRLCAVVWPTWTWVRGHGTPRLSSGSARKLSAPPAAP